MLVLLSIYLVSVFLVSGLIYWWLKDGELSVFLAFLWPLLVPLAVVTVAFGTLAYLPILLIDLIRGRKSSC